MHMWGTERVLEWRVRLIRSSVDEREIMHSLDKELTFALDLRDQCDWYSPKRCRNCAEAR